MGSRYGDAWNWWGWDETIEEITERRYVRVVGQFTLSSPLLPRPTGLPESGCEEMAVTVRQPTEADADGMGAVHVRAWQSAYAGLMPDDYLHSLSVTDRSDMWRRVLSQTPRPRTFRFVAEEPSGMVVGFIAVGPEARADGATGGELYVMNVDPDVWGTGVGSALHRSALAALIESGFAGAILWVHPDNERAGRFYESRGWHQDDVTRQETVLGVQVPELRYSQELV